jgi:hypothetical protein
MDSQDVIKIRYKAKCETEAFINRHLNDGAKGWPRLCPSRSTYTDARREPQTIRPTG